jgi:dTDP-4-amino-4,6-dideoxygalactose transaminase
VTHRLAIDGGTPVRQRPFAPWPIFDDATIEAVADVLRSGRLTYWAGPHGRELERAYAGTLGRAHAVAVANGTLALELALRAFGIGPDDEVIVPTRTFIATASAVVAVGATPVVADIDPDSGCLTAATVAALLTERTRAIIPVHLGGWPVDLDPLLALAAERDLVVIEDCAQAHGATYRGRQVGAPGTHAATFSFCQDKIISAGEGGILVLDDDAAYERAWSYKDHGKSLSALEQPPTAPGAGTDFCWQIERFGSNFRMPEAAAVLVAHGLERLPEWLRARRANAARLALGLEGLPGLRVPQPPEYADPAFYRFYAFLDTDALDPAWTRGRIAAAIAAEGVPCGYGACAELYHEQAFTGASLGPTERLPGAMRAHETSLAFLVHPTLGDREMDDTAEAVTRVFEAAAR